METVQNNHDEIEIDLREIITLIISKLGVIILSGIMLALVALVATKLLITPQYQSTTKMYVLTKQAGDSITQSDMQTSTFLTKDYVELIKSRTVTESVIAQLGLVFDHDDLLGKLSISSPADTRVIEISVKDPDPYTAAEIANSVRDVAAEHIQRVMDIEAVNVVEDANIPQHPSSPNTMRNTVLGGAVGVVLALAVVLIVFLTNDTIKTSEDVERYLSISTLGVIPLTTGEKKNKKKVRKNSVKERK